MQKKLVFLDLDNTLFDSDSYRKSVFEKIGNPSLCQEIYDEFIRESGCFFPREFVDRLSKRTKGVNKEEVLNIIFDPKNFQDNIHEEVLATLSKLTKFGEIGIFSQGDKDFQSAKIANFKHLFHKDRVHIILDKKSFMPKAFMNSKGYKVYFVDDILPMLQIAKKINPSVFTIWIKRGRYAMSQKEIPGFTPDAAITSLKEVIGLVQRGS